MLFRKYLDPVSPRCRGCVEHLVGDALGTTAQPVTVTVRDNVDYIRLLLSYYATITGWGVLLGHIGLNRGYTYIVGVYIYIYI